MSAMFRCLMLIISIAVLVSTSWAQERNVKLTVLLICDIYEIAANSNGRGGLAKVSSVIQRERERNANVIVVHAGDAISPSLMSDLDKGAHMIDLLGDLDLDAFVPGNHEFDFGPDVFKTRMAEARFPVLAGNLRDDNGRVINGILADRLVDVDGIKVGLAGFTAEDSVIKSSPGNLRFTATLDGVYGSTLRLRKAGADIVVQVVHAPREIDMALIREASADVILSGDDHDLLVSYDGQTAFAEAMQDGWYVVAVDLDVKVKKMNNKTKVSWWPNFRIIDTADFAADPAMTARVAAYETRLSEQLDGRLTRTVTRLDSRNARVRGGEAAIGNLFTDALREKMEADIAILNGGGIRGNRVYEAGTELSRRDVLRELPFGNKAFVLPVSGRQLYSVLEQAFAKAENLTSAFPQVSGLTVRVDVTRPPGQRVISASIGDRPVEVDRTYTLAINDFLARGGDGYKALRSVKPIVGDTDAKLMAEVIMTYLAEKPEVTAKLEQRVIVARGKEPK